MRDRTTIRAMQRAEAKRQRKAARAQEQLREKLEDQGYRRELGLPEEMPDDALDIMAQAEAQIRTKYTPNPSTVKRYGLSDASAGVPRTGP